MFRNEGYINLCRIRPMFTQLDRETLSQIEDRECADIYRQSLWRARDPSGERDQPLLEYTIEKAREAVTRSEVRASVEQQMESTFRRYAYQQKLYLSGPSGHVVPASQDILGPNRASRYALKQRWNFVSDRFICVEAAKNIALIEAAKLIVAQAGELSLGQSATASLHQLILLESPTRALLPFDGYFVAVSIDARPDGASIRRAFGLDSPDPDANSGSSSRGRPRKLEEVAEAFASRFPDGRGGYSWKNVMAILAEECGVHVGVDTLRAAVASLEADDQNEK